MRASAKYLVVAILALMPGERADMLVSIAEYDVVNYGSNGHTMTVCWPNDGAKHPAVILLHHGGWKSETRLAIIEQTRALAREGVVACSIDYTLATPATEPALPKVMQDISDAIAMLSRFTCTKDMPVSLGGFSAGGHLALVYAMTQPNTLHAVVTVGAPTDMVAFEAYLQGQSDPVLSYLLGTGYTPADLQAVSPMHMSLAGYDTPTYLAQGEDDPFYGTLVDAVPFFGRVKAAGCDARLIRYRHGSHTLENCAEEWAGAIYPLVAY
jgi:acetyl esterase/lipase